MRYTAEMVADRLEIEDLITDYAAIIDSGEVDKLDDIFIPDADIDYSAMGGAKGKYPEVNEFLRKALKGFRNTQHLISNFEIKLDGDRRRAERAEGRHLRDAGDLPDLAFERGRNRRSHGFGAGARERGRDLNRREINLREWRHRQEEE